MIIVTQSQLRNKDTEAIILLRNEIKASFNTNAIDYFTISAVAEILYNKFKHKNHDIIYHTTVSYDGINKPFKIRINYVTKEKRKDNHKEFAIGTKIEYNGKLYEVVEELFCDKCSIANICTDAEFTNIKNMITFYLENKDIVYLANAQITIELMVHLWYLKKFLKMILNMNIIRFHLYGYIIILFN